MGASTIYYYLISSRRLCRPQVSASSRMFLSSATQRASADWEEGFRRPPALCSSFGSQNLLRSPRGRPIPRPGERHSTLLAVQVHFIPNHFTKNHETWLLLQQLVYTFPIAFSPLRRSWRSDQLQKNSSGSLWNVRHYVSTAAMHARGLNQTPFGTQGRHTDDHNFFPPACHPRREGSSHFARTTWDAQTPTKC